MALVTRAGDSIHNLRRSTNGRILLAASTVAIMTALVRSTSLIKDVVVARQFGTGDALDAFYVGLLVPTFLMGIFGESFRVALVPIYVELREREGAKAAQRLLSNISACSLGALIAIAIPALLLRGKILPILASGFAPAKLATTNTLMAALLGLLPIWGLTTLWRSVLTAHDNFALSSLAPITNPLLILLTVVTLSWRWRIYALVVGCFLGALADMAVCGRALLRSGVSPWPRWHGIDPALRRVLWQCAPMIAGTMIMGSTTVVDQSMAAMLGAGSVSALNYATKILTLPMWVGVHSMSVAVFPTFSEMTAQRKWTELRQVLSTYTRLILLLSVPITIFLFVFSEPLVRLVFQGGAFTARDVHLVAQVQALLCLQLPFYAIGILYVRAISAIKRNQVLMWGNTISVVVNAALNLAFIRVIGLPGIALSTSIVYLLSCAYLRFMLYRLLSEHETKEFVPSFAITPDSAA